MTPPTYPSPGNMAEITVPLRNCKCHPEPVFALENPKFRDYIEWEKYPKKKQEAEEILARFAFAQVSFRVNGTPQPRNLHW